jgi:hypothetical protein
MKSLEAFGQDLELTRLLVATRAIRERVTAGSCLLNVAIRVCYAAAQTRTESVEGR